MKANFKEVLQTICFHGMILLQNFLKIRFHIKNSFILICTPET